MPPTRPHRNAGPGSAPLAGLVLLMLVGPAHHAAAQAAGPAEVDARAQEADTVLAARARVAARSLGQFLSSRDLEAPRQVIGSARCVVVLPEVARAKWAAGRRGKGVAACRDDQGGWGSPAFVSIRNVDFAADARDHFVDLLLAIHDDGARDLLASGRLRLGRDAQVAAGPWEHELAGTSGARPDVEVWVRSTDQLAAVSLDGATLRLHDRANRLAHGGEAGGSALRVDAAPTEATRVFADALRRWAPVGGLMR